MTSVVLKKSVVLSSSPAELWPHVTDTDRMNRLIGGQPVTYRPVDGGASGSARFVGETKAAGFAMEYEEAPFEWTENESFSVRRQMRGGPLRAYSYTVHLDPVDGGTRFTVTLDLEPRHWLLRPILQIQAVRTVDAVARLADAIDAHLRSRAPRPFDQPASAVNEARLAIAERELGKRDLDPRAVRAVTTLVRSGADADLVRIRPFELADAAGVPRIETLRVLLHAVTLGVTELRWAIVCPSCRTANDQVSSLTALAAESHCQLCDITYGLDLDRAVEATFVPHPSVREVQDRMFCIGGPARTPHVLVQANVTHGETRSLAAPDEVARFRLFARGGAVASVAVEADAPSEVAVVLDAEAAHFEPRDILVAPGGTLRVSNAGAETRHVKIERLGYASQAATAHLVTTMGEFRRLFSKELLKPGTPLKVTSCAILFSDLTGSTALYTKAGDAAAFRLVDDHFDVLRAVIEKSGGAVVKTMGDAIMAAFSEPDACVHASVACLRAFEAFRSSHPNGADTGLKLGVFAGPCYVVTANAAIDYFGQTVNCASRVQHLAESGELVVEQELFARLPEADRAALAVVEHLETSVKGVASPLRLVRTRLA